MMSENGGMHLSTSWTKSLTLIVGKVWSGTTEDSRSHLVVYEMEMGYLCGNTEK